MVNIPHEIETWEVWEHDGRMYGRLLGKGTFYPVKQSDWAYIYHFNGQFASYRIVSQSSEVTRDNALWFANQLFQGAVKILTIDLETLTATWKSAPGL